MSTLQETVSSHPFVKGLDPVHLPLLVEDAEEVVFSPDEVIAKEGEAATRFYLLLCGKVEIDANIPERGDVEFQTIGGGEVLGWSWLFPPFKWHFTARVVEETKAIAWDTAKLRARAERNPKFGYELASRMTNVLLNRLQATHSQLVGYYGTPGA